MDIPDFLPILYKLKYHIYKVLNLKYYSIVDLQGRTGVNGEKIHIDSYYAYGLYPNSQRGGFKLVYKSDQAKSGHNGVTVHSPTVPWVGTQATLAAYQAKTGETDAAGSGCWVLESNEISVEMAGAVGDCSGHGTGTDDTGAIKKALSNSRNVYLPEPSSGYYYKITDMVTVSGTQKLFGDGRTKSKFYVDSDFNLSADAVVLIQWQSTGTIDDIGIEFYQDTTNTLRANLIQYPWAVKTNVAAMPRIGSIRISKGYNGVYLAGNAGGTKVGTLELGCLNNNFLIDGALDFVHIESLHIWPFDFTNPSTNLYTSVYSDGNVTAFEVAKCDGLVIDKLAAFRAKVKFSTTDATYIPKIIDTLQLDGDYSVLENNADYVQISKVYSTKTTAQIDPSIQCNSGLVMIGSYHARGTRAAASVDVLAAGGEIKIASGHSAVTSVDAGGFKVTSGTLDLNDMKLAFLVSARTVPYIEETGGILKVTDCDGPVGGSGLGEIIKVATDDASHKIQNNNFSDWTVTLPSTPTLGVYGPNRTGPISYTPTVTFATVGDFSPTYATQFGRMWLEATGVRFEQRIIFTCNAYTTASGDFIISGPPVTFKGLDVVTDVSVQCYSLIDIAAGRTQVSAIKDLTNSRFKLVQYGDNVSRSNLQTSSFPAGTANIEIVMAGFIPTK